jgi:hypothetical protein
VFDFVPGFELDVAGRTVELLLSGSLDCKWCLSSEAKDLSRLFGGAKVGLGVNKDGVVALKLDDAFTSSPGSTSLSLAQSAVSNYNVLDVSLPIRPGGGALTIALPASGSCRASSPMGRWVPRATRS